MSDTPGARVTESLEDLNLSGDWDFPETRKDDPEHPERSVENFLADWSEFQKEYEALGVPSLSVTTDASDKKTLHPPKCDSPEPVGVDETKGEVRATFVTLIRKIIPGEHQESVPGQSGYLQLADAGDSLDEFAKVTVAEAEVSALVAQGWAVKIRSDDFLRDLMAPRAFVNDSGKLSRLSTRSSNRVLEKWNR